MAPNLPSMIIYINGYPGVGKLTVALALRELIPRAKVLDAHNVIDAQCMIRNRYNQEYQPVCQAMRERLLETIASSRSTEDATWILTDQSSTQLGSVAAQTYLKTARRCDWPFISIILSCDLEENINRLSSAARTLNYTKVTDVVILRAIRRMEDIYRFGGPLELEIDVTHKLPHQVAQEINHFLVSCDILRAG